MKNLYLFALLLISFNVIGQTKQPALPGGAINTDNSKPGIMIVGDEAYYTHPGTKTRDYSKPSYIKDSNGILRPTHPGTNSIDRSKPGIVWKGHKAYLTHPNTSQPDYSKPVYIRDSSGSGLLKPISNN